MLRLAVLESLAEALAAVTQRTWTPLLQPDASFEAGSVAPLDADPSARTSQDRPAPHLEMTVANSILDLRLLATQDWKAFFEATSILEKTLRGDPADLYAHGFRDAQPLSQCD
jgi:hypothetical protein